MSRTVRVLRSAAKCAAVFSVAYGLAAPRAATAQSASEVYKKMSDVYAFAKSFRGTIIREEHGVTPAGKTASQTVSVRVSFKAPNKFAVENKRVVNVGGKVQSADQFMVTDGRTLYMYAPDKKVYQRGQVQDENILSRYFALLNPVNGFVLLPETTVNGRKAFVIKPNMPTVGTPQQLAAAKKVKIEIVIDKQTFQFVRMKIASTNGMLTQSVSGQVVNGMVPDSVFAWSPPAGYKEIKAPTGVSTSPTLPGRAPGH